MAVPQKHKWITEERVDKFLSDIYWTDCNLMAAERAFDARHADGLRDVIIKVLSGVGPTPSEPVFPSRLTFEDAKACFETGTLAHGEHFATEPVRPCALGDSFGPLNTTHWFSIDITAHGDAFARHQDKQVTLQWHTGAEGLVFTREGQVICGVTGSGRDFIDLAAIPSQSVEPGLHHAEVYIEMACNSLCGDGRGTSIGPPDADRRFTLTQCSIKTESIALRHLRRDLQLMLDLSRQAEGVNHLVAAEALVEANRAVNVFRFDDVPTHAAALAITNAFFSRMASTAGSQALHQVCLVGHCHIDTAWLWRYCESRRKVARSWASQLHLHHNYIMSRRTQATAEAAEDFLFAASQPVQHDWLHRDYPDLFRRLSEEVRRDGERSGFFVPLGATWVEMDGNLPSGGTMMRQFSVGQAYLTKHYGAPSRVFWLPDTFGYSGQLPQIARLHGVDYFMSQKLSWNLINKPPHSTFWWQGIDGKRSTLLAHFPPADTYTSSMSLEDVVKHSLAKQNKDAGRCTSSLLLFGHGDGGGGPTQVMLERLERLRQVAPAACGVSLDCSTSPTTFFQRLADADSHNPRLQRHVGELYFELHRGTLTTHIRVKHLMRMAEVALSRVELLLVCMRTEGGDASTICQTAAQVEELWRDVLLHQFHDVLPGSSIEDAMKDAKRSLERTIITANDIVSALLQSPCLKRVIGAVEGTAADIVVCATEASPMPSVPTTAILVARPAALLGNNSQPSCRKVEAGFEIVTERIRATVARGGIITSLVVKQDDADWAPNIAGPAGLNRAKLYEDVPFFWDAWDVEIYHTEKPIPIDFASATLDVVTCDDGRITVLSEFKLGTKSKAKVSVSFSSREDNIAVHWEVEWLETHVILKQSHDTTITASTATFEAQFGYVHRPSHTNSSIDQAMFETSMQRWVAIHEPGLLFGVVQTNGMHAATARGSTIEISMVRAPMSPDPSTDRGAHSWDFILTPASAPLGHVVPRLHAAAAALEMLALERFGAGPSLTSLSQAVFETRWQFGTIAPAHIHVSMVRLSADGDTVLFTVAEVAGRQASAPWLGIALRGGPARLQEIDGLGNALAEPQDIDASRPDSAGIELRSFTAFEIRCYALRL